MRRNRATSQVRTGPLRAGPLRLLAGLFAVAVLTLAGPAMAQDAEAAPELQERTIDFSDEIVEGELVRPDGDLIEGQRGRGSTSLITIREHFIDKMIQSAEDI